MMEALKIYAGDRIIDNKGRELYLSGRAKIAGRSGWLAYPVKKEKVQFGHVAVVLNTEIMAVVGDNGQFILAR